MTKANDDLFLAAAALDKVGILAAIKAGADVNAIAKIKQSGTPLTVMVTEVPSIKTIFKAKLECATALLDAGADVDARAHFGSALAWAAMSGDVAFADYLLSKGADPDIRGDGGVSPSMYAARSCGELEGLKQDKMNSLACLRSLFMAGADPFAVDGLGKGLFAHACITVWKYKMGQPARVKCFALLLAAMGAEVIAGAMHCPPSSGGPQETAMDLFGSLDALVGKALPIAAKTGWASVPAIDLAPVKVDAVEAFLLANYV